jgi:hypothetical protein
MPEWQGKRPIAVITACMSAAGLPDFALTEVETTQEEFDNGAHYDKVETRLSANGYDEPFVHFDEHEAPPFLLAAVKDYVHTRASAPNHIVTVTQEEC